MDISSFRERRPDNVMTVSELNSYIKNMFDSSRFLSALTIRGEISNFVSHRSGHLYFSLKDGEGQIRAVMFRSSAQTLKFVPENGMKVTVRGSVSVYVRDGSYQMYVNSMQPDGIGALYLAYEQMKARLEAEGLFDPTKKKSIPRYPRRIGVITSPTGAAVRDIINVIGRRYPVADIYLYPSLVQGDGAEENLIRALDYFDESGLADVIIIGRGGGSIEDLWAFNGEKLARRIFNMNVPVISAVGHETDFTICDFVSDLRAPTPSAAAELAVPDIRELMQRIDSFEDRCVGALRRVVERMKDRLSAVRDREVLRNAESLFGKQREHLGQLKEGAIRAYCDLLNKRRGDLTVAAGKLDVLSPLSVLARGYSVVQKDGKIVRTTRDIRVGDEFEVRLSDGRIQAKVLKNAKTT